MGCLVCHRSESVSHIIKDIELWYIDKFHKFDYAQAMTASTGKNNRKHKRLNVDLPVKILLSEGDIVKAHLANLSVSGAGISYPVAADPGVVLGLQFEVNTRQGREIIQVKSQVVHNFLHRNQYIIGVQFLNISKQQARALGEYLLVLQSLRRQ